MAWDPSQYLKFAGPRLRPALDLLAHIDTEAPRLVYDLGCGAGNVTREAITQYLNTQTVKGVTLLPDLALANHPKSIPALSRITARANKASLKSTR